MTPTARLALAGGPPVPAVPIRFALFTKGFRPFFLAAGLFAVAILPLWLAYLFAVWTPHVALDPINWHAHEMLFGFTSAVIAGFLLTAVGNWTGRETATGLALAGLVALWLLGRVAMFFGGALPPGLTAVADLAFIPTLAFTLGRPLITTRNRKNYLMLAVLAAFWVSDLVVHLDALGVLPGWRRRGVLTAVDVVVLVIVVIAGRVFPMFTRNATGVATVRSIPSLDRLSTASVAVLVLLDLAAPGSVFTPIAAGIASIFTAVRAVPWFTRQVARHPMLWVLHIGYAWIPVGLGLRAAAAITHHVPPAAATHALTVGAIGGLTLGMMARVSLGHSGRPIVAPRPMILAFALMFLAAVARVLGALAGGGIYRAGLAVGGTLWTVAFVVFVLVYAPILTTTSPR